MFNNEITVENGVCDICDLLNFLIQLIHQFFVLFGDFVGDSQLIFHSLQWVLRHVAKGLDGGFSPFVQSSIGISFQVNYLQSERKHSAAFQLSLLPVLFFFAIVA